MKQRKEDVPEEQRALDALVSTAHTLKSRIDAMQCMAITARLDLMESDRLQDRSQIAQTLQPIADELSWLIDEAAALLDTIRNASSGPTGSPRLRLV